MAILKTMWDGIIQAYSCIMGVSISFIWFSALVLVKLFPVPPTQLMFPFWFMLVIIFINILIPIGLGLAIYDIVKGKRWLAAIGVLLCLLPHMSSVIDGIARSY